jgi:hypothetical protein
METMRKFKVGDNVKVTASNETLKVYGCNPEIKNGSLHVITSISDTSCNLNYLLSGYVLPDYLELAKPKWTIYNNTLPWSELSDKQKGKLLLAGNESVEITLDGDIVNDAAFKCKKGVYKAIKPEPTMAEVFESDWYDCSQITGDCAGQMIAKGWTKSCK